MVPSALLFRSCTALLGCSLTTTVAKRTAQASCFILHVLFLTVDHGSILSSTRKTACSCVLTAAVNYLHRYCYARWVIPRKRSLLLSTRLTCSTYLRMKSALSWYRNVYVVRLPPSTLKTIKTKLSLKKGAVLPQDILTS